jgi:hypothetical protein
MDQELKYRHHSGCILTDGAATDRATGSLHSLFASPRRGSGRVFSRWSFVYIFFTNHTPFDAPNRSEPCPPF